MWLRCKIISPLRQLEIKEEFGFLDWVGATVWERGILNLIERSYED
jgi:hypothetical protein